MNLSDLGSFIYSKESLNYKIFSYLVLIFKQEDWDSNLDISQSIKLTIFMAP